jgi:hypothetical protein
MRYTARRQLIRIACLWAIKFHVKRFRLARKATDAEEATF